MSYNQTNNQNKQVNYQAVNNNTSYNHNSSQHSYTLSNTNAAQPISVHPEYGPINDQHVEYNHLQEIVEPKVPEELNAYIEHQHPQYVPQPHVPIQTTTPQLPIQPVQHHNLPLTEFEIENGLKANVMSSIRALAIWCLRQLQIEEYKKQKSHLE